jgi:glycosyltransferase involved in cell wall biosynthesis|tara:strand:- start:327 stop:980 length:654 start_codon:yes stop_codon:yes gene_type:complete
MDKDISVVIRSRNEEQYIGHCIQSITDFIGKPEIIIVDNESIDNTIRVVNRFEYHDITKLYIKKDKYSPGRALNMGIKECTGDYIVILSAHCEITKFNFNLIEEQLNKDRVVAAWGKQIPIWDGKKITRRYMWSNFSDEPQKNYWCDLEERYFFHNAFSFFKSDYLKNNLFDEKWASKEDRYWANDQIERGFDIFYDSKQEVKHYYTPSGATWMGTG